MVIIRGINSGCHTGYSGLNVFVFDFFYSELLLLFVVFNFAYDNNNNKQQTIVSNLNPNLPVTEYIFEQFVYDIFVEY